MAVPVRKGIGYSLLAIGSLLVFDTEVFLETNWSPLYIPLPATTELTLAYFVIACGVVILAPGLIRMLGGYAPGNDVQTAEQLEYQSIEQRRRLRLPLRRKFSALPDRAAIGGSAVLLILVPTFLMVTEHAMPKGVYVRLVPSSPSYYDNSKVSSLSSPILVQVKSKGDSAQIFLNGKKISRDKLRDGLKSELSSRPNWFVFVEGDQDLQFDDVMAVLDVVNGLHAKAILLTARAYN